jgi:hypothetical protein
VNRDVLFHGGVVEQPKDFRIGLMKQNARGSWLTDVKRGTRGGRRAEAIHLTNKLFDRIVFIFNWL